MEESNKYEQSSFGFESESILQSNKSFVNNTPLRLLSSKQSFVVATPQVKARINGRKVSVLVAKRKGRASVTDNVGYLPSEVEILRGPTTKEVPLEPAHQQSRVMSTNDDFDTEESSEEDFLDIFVISTSNFVFQVWKAVIIIASFVSSVEYTQIAAFFEEVEEDEMWTASSILYTVIFSIDLIINFFTEHHSNLKHEPERSQKKIALLYLKGGFLLDFVALIPFKLIAQEWVGLSPRFSNLFQLIKVVRLVVGFRLLNVQTYMIQIKRILHERQEKMAKRNRSKNTDSTNISLILGFSLLLRTLQLVIYVLCGSYFTGMLWLILCKHTKEGEDNFIDTFGLEGQPQGHQIVSLIYFAFTSLSTVGLGDYHPRSNVERAVGAFYLLTGVTLTSYVTENLSIMLRQVHSFNKSFEEENKLAQFFKTMEKFNEDVQIPQGIHDRIEDYFQYRWRHNKTHAISSREDIELFEQLPTTVQRQICSDFLFQEFLMKFQRYFRHLNDLNKQHTLNKKRKRELKKQYTLRYAPTQCDDSMLEFQSRILKQLEPLFFSAGQIIFKPQEAIDFAFFPVQGEVEIGYHFEFFMHSKGVVSPSSNVKFSKSERTFSIYSRALRSFTRTKTQQGKTSKFRYPLMVAPGQVVGFFELMFAKNSQYLYRASKENTCQGFFLRKRAWAKMEDKCRRVGTKTSRNFSRLILKDYIDRIYLPIDLDQQENLVKEKKQRIERQKSRGPNAQSRSRIQSQYSVNNPQGIPVSPNSQFRSSFARSEALDSSDSSFREGVGFIQRLLSRKSSVFKKSMDMGSSVSNVDLSQIEGQTGAEFKKQQTKLVSAITWKDRINDPELKALVYRVMRREVPTDTSSVVTSGPDVPVYKQFERAMEKLSKAQSTVTTLKDENEGLRLINEQKQNLINKLLKQVQEVRKECGCRCLYHTRQREHGLSQSSGDSHNEGGKVASAKKKKKRILRSTVTFENSSDIPKMHSPAIIESKKRTSGEEEFKEFAIAQIDELAPKSTQETPPVIKSRMMQQKHPTQKVSDASLIEIEAHSPDVISEANLNMKEHNPLVTSDERSPSPKRSTEVVLARKQNTKDSPIQNCNKVLSPVAEKENEVGTEGQPASPLMNHSANDKGQQDTKGLLTGSKESSMLVRSSSESSSNSSLLVESRKSLEIKNIRKALSDELSSSDSSSSDPSSQNGLQMIQKKLMLYNESPSITVSHQQANELVESPEAPKTAKLPMAGSPQSSISNQRTFYKPFDPILSRKTKNIGRKSEATLPQNKLLQLNSPVSSKPSQANFFKLVGPKIPTYSKTPKNPQHQADFSSAAKNQTYIKDNESQMTKLSGPQEEKKRSKAPRRIMQGSSSDSHDQKVSATPAFLGNHLIGGHLED